jgi:hypothetical protein
MSAGMSAVLLPFPAAAGAPRSLFRQEFYYAMRRHYVRHGRDRPVRLVVMTAQERRRAMRLLPVAEIIDIDEARVRLRGAVV